MSEMAEAIRALISEKGYSEDSVKQTIEKALKAALQNPLNNLFPKSTLGLLLPFLTSLISSQNRLFA